jgi:branched-chain amino acid transport system substrate-binding protein
VRSSSRKPGIKWLTLLAADEPKFAELGEGALRVSAPSQWAPQVAYKPDLGPTAQAFGKRFTDKFKGAPVDLAAAAYAGGLILAQAIEKAGAIEPGKVVGALNRTDATTMFGRSKFSVDPKEHGAQVAHEMVLLQWQRKGGRFVQEVIWPPAAKTADALGM